MNKDDIIAKIEWEGGLIPVLEYGLGPDDFDEDIENYDEIVDVWNQMDNAFSELRRLTDKMENLLGI